MYPEWPDSADDLVPLPLCDGPKLQPFDFQGWQNIEFLEYLGSGLHAHVIKVKILGKIYALKLFRFVYDDDWPCPDERAHCNKVENVRPFYNYAEPFNAECRAFGRLQESGHDDLAIRCYGYLLLDEKHECAMMNQFKELDEGFNGNGDYPGYWDMRSRFLGRDGKLPPIRAIVKEFGPTVEDLRAKDMRRILKNITQLQQLGIIYIDIAERQLIGGKICDFSLAVTVPHYITTPELNPHLTPEQISLLEFETFQFSIGDYWHFDIMVREWNEDHRTGKTPIAVNAFPNGNGCRVKYDLRGKSSRGRLYSFVDPRRYEWRTVATRLPNGATGVPGQKSSQTKGISKTRKRLETRPPRWYYDSALKDLRKRRSVSVSLAWYAKDGFMFPTKHQYF